MAPRVTAAMLDRRFNVARSELTARLQAAWDAGDPRFNWSFPDGTSGRDPRPVEPQIGADCLAWRKRMIQGKPLITRKVGSFGPSYARTLRRVENEHHYSGGCTYQAAGWRDGPRPLARDERPEDYHAPAPIRVRCPQCERPIRLSKWWDHGCENAIVDHGATILPFEQATAGAAEPSYEVAA